MEENQLLTINPVSLQNDENANMAILTEEIKQYSLLILESPDCSFCLYLKDLIGRSNNSILKNVIGSINWQNINTVINKKTLVQYQTMDGAGVSKLWGFNSIGVPMIFMYKTKDGITADNLIKIEGKELVGLMEASPIHTTLLKFFKNLLTV